MCGRLRWIGGILLTSFSIVLKAAAEDPRVAQAVALTTTGTGLGVLFEGISGAVGSLAAAIGAVLSLYLLIVHIIKGRREIKKLNFEIRALQQASEQAEDISSDILD